MQLLRKNLHIKSVAKTVKVNFSCINKALEWNLFSLGLQPVKTMMYEPATCSMRTCKYSHSMPHSIWIAEKVCLTAFELLSNKILSNAGPSWMWLLFSWWKSNKWWKFLGWEWKVIWYLMPLFSNTLIIFKFLECCKGETVIKIGGINITDNATSTTPGREFKRNKKPCCLSIS